MHCKKVYFTRNKITFGLNEIFIINLLIHKIKNYEKIRM